MECGQNSLSSNSEFCYSCRGKGHSIILQFYQLILELYVTIYYYTIIILNIIILDKIVPSYVYNFFFLIDAALMNYVHMEKSVEACIPHSEKEPLKLSSLLCKGKLAFSPCR